MNKKNIIAIVVCLFIVIAGIITYFCLPAKLILGNYGTAYLSNQIIRDVEIDTTKTPLEIGNKYTLTNDDVNIEVVDLSFVIDRIGLKFSDLENLVSIDVPVLNTKTKDIRIVNFSRNDSKLNGKCKIK